jgi:hypothetical protein
MITMNDVNVEFSVRARSKSYPAISLREAVSRCQALYDKDGWTETLAETAGVHWGYSGLNGGSRPILSALKQFGLIEYSGAGDNLKVKLTDIAKRILRPLEPEERTVAVAEAMNSPKLYASLYQKFSDWNLPSDQTLAARLEREEGIQPRALKSLVTDIKDSVAYLREAMNSATAIGTISLSAAATATIIRNEPNDHPESKQPGAPAGLQTYPMPGGDSYVCLARSMSKEEAMRTKRWIEKVIIPAIEFAGDLEIVD